MNVNPGVSSNRIVFLDNLRYLMVLLVLVFHSAASYSSMVAFWPFHEAKTTEFLDILMILFDTFMMPVLFFIAGYFTLSSLRKTGARGFVRSKFIRLGVPWVVLTVFVLPVLDYFHYASQTFASGTSIHSFAAHWLLSMKTMGSFYVGPMDMSHYSTMPEQFYQRYLWFLSLLLLLSVIVSMLYSARNRWVRARSNTVEEISGSNGSVYKTLVFVGILTAVMYAPTYVFLSPDMGWLSLGNIIQFQPAKLIFYIVYFCLGIYAFDRKWFVSGGDFGRPGIWLLIWFLLTAANLLVGRAMFRSAEPSLGLNLAFGMIYPFWTLSFLCLFVAFGFRRWNRPGPFDRALASHSFDMYLTHYIFPISLPLLLSSWAIGPLGKFSIVALATIVFSYLFSRYVFSLHPRQTIIGIIAVFVILLVLL